MIKRSSARLVVDNREMSAPPPDDMNDPLSSIRTVPSVIPTPDVTDVLVNDTTKKGDSEPSLLSSTSGAAAAMASKVTSYFQPSTEPHELWSFTNALFFLILFFILFHIMNHDRTKVCLFFINIVFVYPVSITSKCFTRIGCTFHG